LGEFLMLMNPKEKKKAEQVGKLEVIYGDPLIF
jgi:hypothetical protein